MGLEEKFHLPIRILHDFASRIESIGLEYMLSGSTAMIYYAVYRFTADIDIVLELRPENISQFVSKFEPDFYVPRTGIKEAVARRSMFNIIHVETAYKVDCVIKKQTEFQLHCFDRRQYVDFFGRDIWVIGSDDLIVSKLSWAKDSRSEMQQRDVKNLMMAGFDEGYVALWSEKLGVYDLFETCKRELME